MYTFIYYLFNHLLHLLCSFIHSLITYLDTSITKISPAKIHTLLDIRFSVHFCSYYAFDKESLICIIGENRFQAFFIIKLNLNLGIFLNFFIKWFFFKYFHTL